LTLFEGFRKGWPAQGCVNCGAEHDVTDMVAARLGSTLDDVKKIPVLLCQKCAQKLREKMVAR